MLHDLYQKRQELVKEGIFFIFNGPISQDLIGELGDSLKQKMAMEEASRQTILKAFSLLVEKAQNIIYYSAEKNEESERDLSPGAGIIVVGVEDEHYFVMTGNKIENHKKASLKEKLTRLQQMDKDELKKYYKAQRKKNPEEGSKGAGLGFIEMARKASKPIEFNIQEIDAHYSFFSLKTII